ncbi:hypothetical protein [Ochrobactrum sp. AN78]|uniref:hypothetical protein n=1 Tax=Ochrobactrum sp. AN78 TaxID=3039853 RepID=UPI002989C9F3|nr:hypothetical protein [Ochrobactrum sp. AN78]
MYGHPEIHRRILWMAFSGRDWVGYRRSQNGSLGGAIIGAIRGYAPVSTGDQDVALQTMRLEQVGAIKVFTDGKSRKFMDRHGLATGCLRSCWRQTGDRPARPPWPVVD